MKYILINCTIGNLRKMFCTLIEYERTFVIFLKKMEDVGLYKGKGKLYLELEEKCCRISERKFK